MLMLDVAPEPAYARAERALSGVPLANLSLGGLSVEITMLVLSILLGFALLLFATHLSTAERGIKWNMGPRDETPPLTGKLAGRAERASRNFMETFPFFAAAVIAASVIGRSNALTVWGSQLYFWARVLHAPLYWLGVPGLRSLVWLASIVGLAMILVALVQG
jgi:uncharacterized MAPEG superfamily protein